jgi:hypothetical protein
MSFVVRHFAMTADVCDGLGEMIDILPDEVLLEIFDFYVNRRPHYEAWQSLVHVCRHGEALFLDHRVA